MATPTPNPKPLKQCRICAGSWASFPKTPKTCTPKHSASERACSECWEAHLSTQIEERPAAKIECIFCPSVIPREEVDRLAHVESLIRQVQKIVQPAYENIPSRPGANKASRYDLKLTDSSRRRCQDRCPASIAHGLQTHDRSLQGRIFTCQFCTFQTCIDCDRPEHALQTCEEYRSTVVFAPTHARKEAATLAAYRACPGCGSIFETNKCGYTECSACAFRFCSRCMIPWVGEGGAYLGGKGAHLEGCLYRDRDAESRHSRKRRWEPDEGTKGRLREREEVKRVKRKKKKFDAEMG